MVKERQMRPRLVTVRLLAFASLAALLIASNSRGDSPSVQLSDAKPAAGSF